MDKEAHDEKENKKMQIARKENIVKKLKRKHKNL